MTARYDVIVIGAGVVGLSAAGELGSRGAGVLVLDADPAGGAGSRAAAGVALPSLRLLADPVMSGFVARAKQRMDRDVAALEPAAPGIRRGRGVLRPVRGSAERDALQRLAEADPAVLGSWVEQAELAGLEPVLADTEFSGAFLTGAGYVVDTGCYLDGLAATARRAGVTIRLGARVSGVQQDAGGVRVATPAGTAAADWLVVAAGAWSGVLPGLPRLPVRPVRGQLVELCHPELRLGRIVSGRTYLCPWRSGGLCVGATEEDAGFADQVTASAVAYLLGRLVRDFPLLADARPRRCWAGLRSAAGDGRLVLGGYPGTTRVLVGTAHGGQGILTGGYSGWMLAELIEGHDPGLPPEFAPSREAAPADRRQRSG